MALQPSTTTPRPQPKNPDRSPQRAEQPPRVLQLADRQRIRGAGRTGRASLPSSISGGVLSTRRSLNRNRRPATRPVMTPPPRYSTTPVTAGDPVIRNEPTRPARFNRRPDTR